MRLHVAVLLVSSIASAECKLSALKPIALPEELQHRVNNSEMPWPYLAVLVDGGTEQATMIDALDPKRFAAVDVDVKYSVYTKRAIALAPYSGKLYADKKEIYQAKLLRPVLDAVDGTKGETYIVVVDPGLTLLKFDGKMTRTPLTPPGQIAQARITRVGDRLAVAWLAVTGGQKHMVTSLYVQFVDGKPIRLDGAAEFQQLADIVLAPSGSGVVVGWNPIAGTPDKKQVPIELRLFHVDPGAPPKLVRRDVMSSALWNVPGSAGGYLPNYAQASSTKTGTVVTWLDESGLWAAPAEGGAPTRLMKEEMPGEPRLRADGVMVFWDRNQGKHVRATLTCGTSTPMTLAPLPTPPPEPTRVTAADLERAWQHLIELAKSDPEMSKQLAAATPEEKKRRLSQIVISGAFDCLMAAKNLDELEKCN